MIPLQVLIDRLESQTPYTTVRTRPIETEDFSLGELPIITVNYSSIVSKNPEAPIEHDIYNTYGEDLVQVYDLQILCLEDEFHTIWRTVYKALIGYTPSATISGTEATSGFTYAQGVVMGISNGKVQWGERWRIGFPTIPVSM
jgi:hypothetical protein